MYVGCRSPLSIDSGANKPVARVHVKIDLLSVDEPSRLRVPESPAERFRSRNTIIVPVPVRMAVGTSYASSG